MIKKFIFSILFFFLFFPHLSLADTEWKITDFSSDIKIQNDGYVRITETISTDFGTNKKHGIFRDIPLGYKTSDGKIITTEIRINSVTDGVNSINYKSSIINGFLHLQIGNENSFVSGKQNYVIDYLVRGILKGFGGYDELYWNATGNEWSAPIEHARISVALPSDGIIQQSCYFGVVGATTECEGKKISGSVLYFSTPRTLQKSEGVTIAVGFTKGLVPILSPLLETPPVPQKTSSKTDLFSFIVTLALGIFFIVILWWKKGRDLKSDGSPVAIFEHETIIAEYEPPLRLRPGEIGVMLDETADTLDITATIVDLAVRGFLTIEEIPKKWFLGSTDYRLTKTSADEKNLLGYEKKLLNALFKERSMNFSDLFQMIENKEKEPAITEQTVEISDLKNSFYKDLQEVKNELYKEVTRKKLFDESPQKTRIKYGFITISQILVGFALAKLAGVYGVGFALLIVGFFGTLLVQKIMMRRTGLGHSVYLKAKGYKLFISQTETYRQQFFEKENTFMEVLPYALVFGVTDKLANAMKDMGVNPTTPSWYLSSNAFNARMFAGNMNDFSKSLSSAMASAPGGSGSGGGGSSGGGFGGGGGGSW
jgi:uncharacterized membrane protein